jgi:hypothetical protein
MRDPRTGLDLDESGNIIMFPVSGWTTVSAMDSAVILALTYLRSPEELQTNSQSQIQFVMTPPQCLEIAEALRRAGEKLMSATPGGGVN